MLLATPQRHAAWEKIDHKDAIEADGSLNFFWTDYTEINGSLCFFGKVLNKKTQEYVSCFVKVDNILRKLFFLPREHHLRGGEETDESVEMMDVYNEVDDRYRVLIQRRHVSVIVAGGNGRRRRQQSCI